MHSLLLIIVTGCLFYATIGISLWLATHYESSGDYAGYDTVVYIGLLGAYLWFAVSIWCEFALSAKRFHDQDRSAAYFLLVLIPFVGGLITLIMLGFTTGTKGGNEYGPDPSRDPNDHEDAMPPIGHIPRPHKVPFRCERGFRGMTITPIHPPAGEEDTR